MVWKIKSINHSTTPAHEGERTYDTEAGFESAMQDALTDPKTRLVSATLPDRTVLYEGELRKRYGPPEQPSEPPQST
jgi:hypothetical protein